MGILSFRSQGNLILSAVFLFSALRTDAGPPNAGGLDRGLADISSGTISLRTVREIASVNNPEIRAAFKRWEAAQKRIIQAATPDNPRLDLERMYALREEGVWRAAQERNFVVTQEIPFPSKLMLRRGLAAQQAHMAHEAYRAKFRDIMAKIRSAYAMLYFSRRSIEIYEENIELMRQFTKVAESKYIAGHSGQSDVLKAQVELTKILNMTVLFAQDKEIAETTLNALLGRDARSPLGAPEESSFEVWDKKLTDLEASSLVYRPEIRMARFELNRAGASLDLARSGYWPDFMLSYRRRHDLMAGDTHDAMIGLSIPLWFWRHSGMVEEAKADREASEAELRAAEVMALGELRSAYARAQTSARLVQIFKTSVFPQAQEALKVAQAGYQADKSSFLDLLDAQRTLLGFRLEYYRHLADYENWLAELERIAGSEE